MVVLLLSSKLAAVEAHSGTDGKDSKSKSSSGIEDLLEEASPVIPPLAPENSPGNLNAEENSATTDNHTRRDAESKSQSSSGVEDLFKDSTSAMTPPAPEKSQTMTTVKSQENVKNDILNLFEKVCRSACSQES